MSFFKIIYTNINFVTSNVRQLWFLSNYLRLLSIIFRWSPNKWKYKLSETSWVGKGKGKGKGLAVEVVSGGVVCTERERERIPICSLKGSREIKNQFLAPPTYLITISHALRSYKALRRSLSTSLLSSSSSSSSSSHWCVC